MRAFKEQISQDRPSIRTLLKIISVITHNVEVGSKKDFNERTVLAVRRCSPRRCRAGISSR